MTAAAAPDMINARHEAAIIATWHDFTRWIGISEELHALRTQQASAPSAANFEIGEGLAGREAALRAQLQRIPGELRARFDGVYNEHRATLTTQLTQELVQSGAASRIPDPDLLTARTLAALRERVSGGTSGVGWVPMADGGYEVDTARLQDVPPESAFRLAGRGGNKRQQQILAAVIAVVGVSLAVWSAIPRAQVALASVDGLVQVGDTTVAPWTPVSAFVARSGDPQRFDLTQTGADVPVWHLGATWPPTFCVPGALLDGVTSIVLTSAGDAPERRYLLDRAGDDLQVTACGDPTRHRAARLDAITPPPAAAPGERRPAAVAGRDLTLVAFTTIDVANDPTLPAGQIQIVATVRVTESTSLDWGVFGPTLVLPDGQGLLPTATEATGEGMRLRYLAPADTTGRTVVWQLRSDARAPIIRWQAEVPPPVDRVALLRRMLAPQIALRRAADGTPLLAITVTNASDAPLTIDARDLVLRDAQDAPLPIVLTADTTDFFRTPLAPAGTRVALLRLAPDSGALTLSFAGLSARLEPPSP